MIFLLQHQKTFFSSMFLLTSIIFPLCYSTSFHLFASNVSVEVQRGKRHFRYFKQREFNTGYQLHMYLRSSEAKQRKSNQLAVARNIGRDNKRKWCYQSTKIRTRINYQKLGKKKKAGATLLKQRPALLLRVGITENTGTAEDIVQGRELREIALIPSSLPTDVQSSDSPL